MGHGRAAAQRAAAPDPYQSRGPATGGPGRQAEEAVGMAGRGRREYLRCPGCGARRVTLRLGAEDWWVCDRAACGWSAPRDAAGCGEGDRARLAALAAAQTAARGEGGEGGEGCGQPVDDGAAGRGPGGAREGVEV